MLSCLTKFRFLASSGAAADLKSLGNSIGSCSYQARFTAPRYISIAANHNQLIFDEKQNQSSYSITSTINKSYPRHLSTDRSVKPQPPSLNEVLDREIQEESSELGRNLSSDQFPGFSVEADGADVILTKTIGDSNVTVHFSVSSSLTDWPCMAPKEDTGADKDQLSSQLVSMPDFQVKIQRGNRFLDMSCSFLEMDQEEESENGEMDFEHQFTIDELVVYEGEPKETEFEVSAVYLNEELQDSLHSYLAEHGLDEAFASNLVTFATNYEKKQYLSLLKRLKAFVSK